MNIRHLLLLSALHFSLAPLSAVDIQTSYPLPSGHRPISVASSRNGTDVMIASHGSIAVRKNAGEWKFLYSGNATETFTDLAFASGLFVAVGVTQEEGEEQGFVLTSPDGEEWQRNLIPEARALSSVTFGKGTFVISGRLDQDRFGDPRPATFLSDNAKTWKTHDLSQPASGRAADTVRSPLTVIRFLAGRFIATDSREFYGSDDAVKWSRTGGGTPNEGGIAEIAGNRSRLLVAVGKGGLRISRSGGLSWEKIEAASRWLDVAYFAEKDLFVAVGSRYETIESRGPQPKPVDGIAISKNGTNWTFVTENQFLPDAALLTTICDAGKELVAAGPAAAHTGTTTVMTSGDGQSWATRYLSQFIWEGIFAADETYYAAGGAADPVSPGDHSEFTYRGAVLKSTDGLDWEPILETSVYLRAVAKGGGQLVAVGGATDDRKFDEVFYLEDGERWESAAVGDDTDVLHDVVFGNGRFVAVGTSGAADRLSSAIFFAEKEAGSRFWRKARNASKGRELKAVAYGEPQGVPTFIAVGTDSRDGDPLILRSSDGETWNDVTPSFGPAQRGEKIGLRDVIFANGNFTAVGNGRFCSSKDGKKWDTLLPHNPRQMSAVGAGPENLYIASDTSANKRDTDFHSVLRPLIQTGRLRDGWEFEPIHSLAAKGKTLIVGADDGISRVILKPVITISPAPKYARNSAHEDDARDAFFVVTSDEEPSTELATEKLPILYQFTGTATLRKDYDAPGAGTVELRGTQARIPVPITNDAEVETPEDIVCTIVQSPDYVVGTPKRASITILSDDSPTCNFSATSAQVTEGADLEIVVRRNSDSGKTTLKVTAHSSSTTSPNDYTLDETVMFKPGETTQKLSLRALADSLGEETESLVLQLTAVENGKVGAKSTMTIRLLNQGGNMIAVITTVGGTGEGSPEVGNFRIERTGGTNAVSVNITISGTATNGTDYNLISSPVVIPANVNFVDVGVTPIPDTDVEGDETIVLTLQPGTGYSVGAAADASVNLLDDDD